MPVLVFTDHNNLRYFMSSRHLNRRQARWSLFLADFNFELVVRPGSQQVVSDALSRQESLQIHPEDEEYTINEKILLPKDKFIYKGRGSKLATDSLTDSLQANALSTSEEEMSELNSDYDAAEYESTAYEDDFDEDDLSAIGDLSQFMEFQGETESEDPLWFQYLLTYLWTGSLPMVLPSPLLNKLKKLSTAYIFKNDRLFRKLTKDGHTYHAAYVPYLDREQLVSKYHKVLGHMQANTVFPLLKVRYFWPGMLGDIKKFQSRCPQCQLASTTRDLKLRPLHPHDPVGLPFMKWGIDFVQDLPEVNGYCNIFSARCYATKRVIYVATKDRTARTAANCIFREIVCKFGAPLEIVSDRGFMDTVLKEYLRILEIQHLPSSSYTPRTNGLDERGHQDLKNIITKLSNGVPAKWFTILPLAEFILNSRISDSSGFSAFYLTHGFEPRLPGDEWPSLPPGAYDLTDSVDAAAYSARQLEILGQNRAAALQRLRVQAARMKQNYDRKVGVLEHAYQVGDVVKLINHSRTRFKFRYLGPFYIADHGPNGTYFLIRPDGRRWTSMNGVDTPVNPDHLSSYTEFDGEYYYDGQDIQLVADTTQH
jgi:hypothetical protein